MSLLDLKVSKSQLDESNQLELTVEASSEILDKAYSLALRDITNNLNIPGFRKGKAPKDIVEKQVGIGYISQKAFESLFYDILISAATQEKIEVVDVLEITSFQLLPGKPLIFKAKVEQKPEVKLGKYKSLKVNAKKIAYDEEIFTNKTLERLTNNLITFKQITDRPLKEGDQVVLDFEGKFSNGSEVPGGKAQNYQAILEKDKFLPEFVEKLKGTKIGETKEIKVTFPQGNDKDFSGKEAVFTVKVNSIEEKEVPQINDQLAKKVGLENLEALKKKIKDQMIELEKMNSQVNFENKLVENIVQSSKFEISKRMIEKEIDYLLNDLKINCEKNNLNWDQFKVDEKNKKLLENAKDVAIKRISIDLVLSSIIKAESITVSEEELAKEVSNRIRQLGDQYKKLENDTGFRNSVGMVALRNKAVDILVKNNDVTWEKEVTKIIPE